MIKHERESFYEIKVMHSYFTSREVNQLAFDLYFDLDLRINQLEFKSCEDVFDANDRYKSKTLVQCL